ncbi:hypothetical protein ATANTOWER_030375, partial [Ataeniobius toweri]|nr:hypothetical protein [Ataeniobius toweri]
MALRHEDDDIDDSTPHLRKERRKMAASDQEGRRNRRSSSQNLPDLLSSSPTSAAVLSPSSTVSTPSVTPTLGSRASSPLSSETGSSASSPSGSRKSSPLPPHAAANSDVSTEPDTKTPPSPLSPSDLSPQETEPSQQNSEQPNIKQEPRPRLNPEDCDVNLNKPVLRKLQGAFLRSLAATQWEKKRRSKHLTQSQLPISDDVITPSPHTASEPSESTAPGHPASASGSLDTNSNSQNDPAVPVQRQCSTLSDEKMFVLDMIYSNSSATVPQSPTGAVPGTTEEEEEHSFTAGEDLGGRVSERMSNFRACLVESTGGANESSASRRAELGDLEGSAQAARARLAEEQK